MKNPKCVRSAAAAASLVMAVAFLTRCSAESTPETWEDEFTDEAVISSLEAPIALAFARDGGLFVAEKKGRILFYQSTRDARPTTVADLSERVLDFQDRGLLSMTLHPDFPATPYLYALYTLDAPLGGEPPVYQDSDNQEQGAASAKLTRLTLEGSAARGYRVVAEQDLLHDFCIVFRSHSIGTVRFGPDGALYVSAGEGASFDVADVGQLENYCGDPPGEGGALRAQDVLTPDDPTSLDGAVLRIDPETGEPLADNPLAWHPDANARRIIAWGLRNPFRFTFRPGTSEIWIGDVGWRTWEEINRIADPWQPNNFGWPCYEGAGPTPEYRDTAFCQALYRVVDGDPSAHTPPYHAYRHGSKDDAGRCEGPGGAISGLAFYDGSHSSHGARFPEHFQGGLFYADFMRGCIWFLPAGEDGLPDPRQEEIFSSEASTPVDLQVGPDGSLYYVSVGTGEIHRVRHGSAARGTKE